MEIELNESEQYLYNIMYKRLDEEFRKNLIKIGTNTETYLPKEFNDSKTKEKGECGS